MTPHLSGPPGAAPHFHAHRPDHSSPELLSDAELVHAIDSLNRKLYSARRMQVRSTVGRIGLYALIGGGGIGILTLLPLPFAELAEGQRALATPWDIFAWWFALLAVASVLGTFAVHASRKGQRRAAGWQARAEELERRLADAVRVQRERQQAG